MSYAVLRHVSSHDNVVASWVRVIQSNQVNLFYKVPVSGRRFAFVWQVVGKDDLPKVHFTFFLWGRFCGFFCMRNCAFIVFIDCMLHECPRCGGELCCIVGGCSILIILFIVFYLTYYVVLYKINDVWFDFVYS